jgi:hypothetical protein
MQIAAGSWILDATPMAPARPLAREEGPKRTPPRPETWTPPAAQGRGLLVDLLV